MIFQASQNGCSCSLHVFCQDGFSPAVPEIKNGKVTDYQVGIKRKNLFFVLEI